MKRSLATFSGVDVPAKRSAPTLNVPADILNDEMGSDKENCPPSSDFLTSVEANGCNSAPPPAPESQLVSCLRILESPNSQPVIHIPPNPSASASGRRYRSRYKSASVAAQQNQTSNSDQEQVRGLGLKICATVICNILKNHDSLEYNIIVDNMVEILQLEECHLVNVRRRTYDVLNVLAAIGCVSKVDKKYKWIDLTIDDICVNVYNKSTNEKIRQLESERHAANMRLERKERKLREESMEAYLWHAKVEYNKAHPGNGGFPESTFIVSFPPIDPCNLVISEQHPGELVIHSPVRPLSVFSPISLLYKVGYAEAVALYNVHPECKKEVDDFFRPIKQSGSLVTFLARCAEQEELSTLKPLFKRDDELAPLTLP